MISVITSVLNGEQFIEECINAVIAQNYYELEHIIMDGGSTDQTVKIIKHYSENYPHIRWLSEEDQGQSDALNKGIAIAKGNIIAILNVDDFYEPNVLNRIARIFKQLPEPSLLVGNCNIWDDEAKLKTVNKPAKLNLRDLLLGNWVNPFSVNPSAYFYHTSLHQQIGFYQVDEHYGMDLDFLLRAVQVATVKYVDETWGNYRQIEGTKTFKDIKSGQHHPRKVSILKFYRKDLPLFQRWQLAITYEFYYNWERLKFFLLVKPQALLPKLRVVLMRIAQPGFQGSKKNSSS